MHADSSRCRAYVYCVIKRAHVSFSARAIGGSDAPVFIADYGDLAAVVSESAVDRYDIGRANTLAHQLVLEEAMAYSEVLPVRFGTVARSVQEVVEKLLKARFDELHDLMHRVEGRHELGLKVFWHKERLFEHIAATDPHVRSVRDEIFGTPGAATYLERIRLGQLIAEAILHARRDDGAAILAQLRPLAVETRVSTILTDMMVLNASFLVDRVREPAFDAAVDALSAAQSDRFGFKYVGPVPPYNFVNLTLNWDG